MGAEARLVELKLELPPAQAGRHLCDSHTTWGFDLCVGTRTVPIRRDVDHRQVRGRHGRVSRSGGRETDGVGDPLNHVDT